MVNKKFEAYKVEREIKRSGTDYQVLRAGTNDFGEPTGKLEVAGSIRGLYHEENSSISIATGETTQIRTKKIPSVLCLFEDVKGIVPMLKVGDRIQSKESGKTFLLTGVTDVQEWHIIADMSMECIDAGKVLQEANEG